MMMMMIMMIAYSNTRTHTWTRIHVSPVIRYSIILPDVLILSVLLYRSSQTQSIREYTKMKILILRVSGQP